MHWMTLPLKHYARFSGRSLRMEFWMFALFLIVGSFVASALDAVLGLGGDMWRYSYTGTGIAGAGGGMRGGVLEGIFSLLMLIPSIAVTVRRLHDIDKSGWWILIGLIPLIGWIVLIVWYCTEGTRGPNRFGQDPRVMPDL